MCIHMLYMYTCNMYMYIDTVSFGRYNLSIPMGYVNGIYIYICIDIHIDVIWEFMGFKWIYDIFGDSTPGCLSSELGIHQFS